MTDKESPSAEPPKRQTRNRKATEAKAFDAARRLLARDGILAGLNLREVATEAGVNRGLIYQHFGSRRALLRGALGERLAKYRARRQAFAELPFARRQRAVFESLIKLEDVIEFEALLALDGDPELSVLIDFDVTLKDLQADVERGALSSDADGVALHIAASSLISGYIILRRAYARDVKCDLKKLDARVLKAFDELLRPYETRAD